MNTKPILYDLGVSIGAISLWLVPVDALRLVGYSTSFIFAGDAYLRGLALISRERRADEKVAIAYEAETDFYDQLLSQTTEAKLEIAALEVETRMLERLIPLVEQKRRLEEELNRVSPSDNRAVSDSVQNRLELDDSEEGTSQSGSEVTEEVIRAQFPEQMDTTTWKAICKALGDGVNRAEIVKEVLGCSGGQSGVGSAYFDLLKKKFLEG